MQMKTKRQGFTLVETICVMFLTAIFILALTSLIGMANELADFGANQEMLISNISARHFLFYDVKQATQIMLISATNILIHTKDSIISYRVLPDGVYRNDDKILDSTMGQFDVVNDTVVIDFPNYFSMEIQMEAVRNEST